MAWWHDRDYYPPSTPRKAKGGIKAQSQRGRFGESWWAKRWIAVLESFDIGARLGRGRSYARQGQVLSIEIEKGLVRAEVQGSRPSPYEITIEAKTLAQSEWKELAKALSSEAIFAAKLLAGEMPQDIEKVFQDCGLSLFPEKSRDLKTECSCPDWSNPCKHIAAVYYLLGEEFDRDPFLIFTLRGLSREEFLALLGKVAEPAAVASAQDRSLPEVIESASLPPEPLDADVSRFWGESSLSADAFGEVATPPVSAALPKRLGSFPFWRAGEPFLPALETIYSAASQRGLDVFLGQQCNKLSQSD